MTRIADLHRKWLEDPNYRAAYAALESEFAEARRVVAPDGFVRFEVFRDGSGGFRWRMRAENGNEVMVSDPYATADEARAAIGALKDSISVAEIAEVAA
ncbi:MAG: DUF1508 domain-containing protein [Bauldia sp.]|nr:DUF1508 domain-containing protein [Bauldia sp.]